MLAHRDPPRQHPYRPPDTSLCYYARTLDTSHAPPSMASALALVSRATLMTMTEMTEKVPSPKDLRARAKKRSMARKR